MSSLSPLQRFRLDYVPKLPKLLQKILTLSAYPSKRHPLKAIDSTVTDLFPEIGHRPLLEFEEGDKNTPSPLKVGVVLSGGQAPGGHNVISGVYDAIKSIHPDSALIGFCDGPGGIVENKTIAITEQLLARYRNQGGFDIIGSGRVKIEDPEQLSAAERAVSFHDLDGLVIIGGDDSNTNAVFLAEYFKAKGLKTAVVGVPKTIDGDLKNEFIEISFGFDTATKIYSEMIGNILIDMLSAKKYYYFIKLMGRSASHITLECALQTHPNKALISEEIASNNQTLDQVIDEIVDMIQQRAKQGKNYGAILIPEGVIEFIPEFRQMIDELNLLAGKGRVDQWEANLSTDAKHCFKSMPEMIQKQLLMDRDPHGNVQVSKIETERLFISMVETRLSQLAMDGAYNGKFNAQPLFFGYEGRAGLPSNFDCQYSYALGYTAALLVYKNANGYMSCIRNLTKHSEEWEIFGVPITNMLHKEKRKGKDKVVIKKALVELQGRPFKEFQSYRDKWLLADEYRNPGPIQFYGDSELTESLTFTLMYENQ